MDKIETSIRFEIKIQSFRHDDSYKTLYILWNEIKRDKMDILRNSIIDRGITKTLKEIDKVRHFLKWFNNLEVGS